MRSFPSIRLKLTNLEKQAARSFPARRKQILHQNLQIHHPPPSRKSVKADPSPTPKGRVGCPRGNSK
jgi:hypothetical protein